MRVYDKDQRHDCGRAVRHSVTKAIETIVEDIVDVKVYRWHTASLAMMRGCGWCSVPIRFPA
jgi:hypothetical protein